MITSPDYFEPVTSAIKNILHNEEKPLAAYLITTRGYHYHDKAYYQAFYEQQFINFPVETTQSASKIGLDLRFLLFFHRYYNLDSSVKTDAELQDEVKNTSEEGAIWDIWDMIEDRFHTLFWEFSKALELAKESVYFAGISDPVLILKNLINHYVSILNDPQVQLDHFHGIHLTKELSDLMTGAYVSLLEDRLAMLEIHDIRKPKPIIASARDDFRIKWKGRQLDFAELFIELQRKDWITPLDEPSLRKSAELLCRLFDLSDTQRHSRSRVEDSIYQSLKGEYDTKKEKRYKFEQQGYQRKFDQIACNDQRPGNAVEK